MAKKKSFIFYLDNYTESVSNLTYEQKGMLFDAIVAEAGGIAKKPELGMISLAFDPIKATMKRDAEKYEKICARNRNNGKKGGRPEKPSETQKNPEKPSGLITNPKKADNDNDNGKDKDISTDDPFGPSGHLSGLCRDTSPERWAGYFEYSEWFLNKQQEALGKLVKITPERIKAGAKAMDNLIRVQGFEEKVVRETLRWGMKDVSFWQDQLRSLGGITKNGKNGNSKFSNLLAARRKAMIKEKNQGHAGKTIFEQNAETARQVYEARQNGQRSFLSGLTEG